MRPRMVLKAFGFVGFVFLFAIGARAEVSDGCRRVETTYADFEKTIDCNVLGGPGNSNYETYRFMCAGCDPLENMNGANRDAGEDVVQRRLHPNAANAGGLRPGFDVGNSDPAGPNVLADLNRIPTDTALMKMVMPNLDGAKCGRKSAKTKYRTEHEAECADYDYLGATFYGDGEIGRAIESDRKPLIDAVTRSHKAVDEATTKSVRKNDHGIFETACREQNRSFDGVRKRYNARLGEHKDRIWTNILNEMLVKRGCLAEFVDDYPAHWCSANLVKGELPSTNKDACLKSLAAKPAKILELFKKYAADPTTLLARANQKKSGFGTRAPEVQPIDLKGMKPIDPIRDRVREQDTGTKPPERSGNGG